MNSIYDYLYTKQVEYKDGTKQVEYKDGTYHGVFKNGKRNGKGTMKYNDGSLYVDDGSLYVGQWENDKRHGKGNMKYKDGSVYEGEWKDGKRNGKGTMKYNDGSVYEGQWENNKRHGKGNMKYKDGSVYEGEWEDGKKVYNTTILQNENNEPSKGNPSDLNNFSNLAIKENAIEEEKKAAQEKAVEEIQFGDESVAVKMNEMNTNVHDNMNEIVKILKKDYKNYSNHTNKLLKRKGSIRVVLDSYLENIEGVISIILTFHYKSQDGSSLDKCSIVKLCSIKYLINIIFYVFYQRCENNHYIYDDIFDKIKGFDAQCLKIYKEHLTKIHTNVIANNNLREVICYSMLNINNRTIEINVDETGKVNVTHVNLPKQPNASPPPEEINAPLKETNAPPKETNASLKETNASLKETNAGTRKRNNRKYKRKYSKKHTKCIHKKCVKKSRKKIRK
jgi:hypothetical protein